MSSHQISTDYWHTIPVRPGLIIGAIISNTNTSYFQTLPNVRIHRDQRGCLVIEAPDVAEGKVITNDVVKIISPHQFEWLGRFDNMVNSGGEEDPFAESTKS